MHHHHMRQVLDVSIIDQPNNGLVMAALITATPLFLLYEGLHQHGDDTLLLLPPPLPPKGYRLMAIVICLRT